MAKATVECKCATCGATFTKTKICYNSTEARNFENWAKENCDMCPDCYAKMMKEYRNSKSKSIVDMLTDGEGLPEITGVSEKQVKYATDLRKKVVEWATESAVKRYKKFLSIITSPNFKEECAEHNTTPEQAIERCVYCSGIQFRKIYCIMTQTNAKELIETLNRY